MSARVKYNMGIAEEREAAQANIEETKKIQRCSICKAPRY